MGHRGQEQPALINLVVLVLCVFQILKLLLFNLVINIFLCLKDYMTQEATAFRNIQCRIPIAN